MAMQSPKPVSRGWRLWVSRFALAIAGPIVLLLALEGGLGLGGFGYPTDFALKVKDTGSYGMNLRFGWRFFPKSIARSSQLFSFPEVKPPETYRIFVLGASAAQGYPRGAFSFSRILEVMLEDAYPATDFEIINTSIVATNSHVVLPIAHECADYDPDMFLVYLGNNEVIGPYGLGSSATKTAGALGAVRAGIKLRTTKVGQLGQHFVDSFSGNDELLENWGGMEMFAEQFVTRDDPALEPVLANFAANLADIRRVAEDADAQIVFSTVAVNIWDGAPFASRHRSDLAAEDLVRWEQAWNDGLEASASGRFAEAAGFFAVAAGLDDQYAELSWRQGQTALALGDTTSAATHLIAAKELDVLRFRADEQINNVIRNAAAEQQLVDAAAVFFAAGPDLDIDPLERRFYEHVHLTFKGHYDLAAAFFPVVSRALPEGVRQGDVPDPTSRTQCADALLWSDWEAWQTVRMLRTLLDDHPFPERADHADITARWSTVADRLESTIKPEQLTAMLPAYESRIKADPSDMLTRSLYADALRAAGQDGTARRQWQYIQRHQPSVEWMK